MTLEELKKRKHALGYSAKELSRLSGVPYGTLQKLLSGATASPRRETLLALERFFTLEENQGNPGPYPESAGAKPVFVREGAYAYAAERSLGKVQGEYTLEDYLALPDERRVELIDGVFYDMASPSASHQLIAGEIYRTISSYIREQKGACVPFIAPYDVQLDCDDKTILEPDVFIVCDRSKIHNARCFGAPDFIIEVLSPSTRKKDLFIKLNKYQNAGVREYWAIDLRKRLIYVYEFNKEEFMTTYTFEDKVPVGLYGGSLLIDFADIADYISWIQN